MEKAPDAFRTISEVADELDLPQHVLRFWETRFSQIRPMKRGGGRRYYRPDDVDLLRGIRHLLYGEGYTIRGVQRILKDHGVKFVQTVWQAGAPQPPKAPSDVEEAESTARSGRRLFALLPSLGGDAEDAGAEHLARREPPIEEVPQSSAAAPSSGRSAELDRPADAPRLRAEDAHPAATRGGGGSAGGVARDGIRKLQATLAELTECRRLLDAALASDG